MTEEIEPTLKSAPADRATAGPFDDSEANPVRPYIDLGGIKVLPREGLNLRLEVEEQSKRIVAVGLDYAGSSLQVQPFAAPRTRGLWDETRVQLRDRHDAGTVFVAARQVKPEILKTRDAEVLQPRGQCRADARQPRDRRQTGIVGGFAQSDAICAELSQRPAPGSRRPRFLRRAAGPRRRWSSAPETAPGNTPASLH